MRMQILELPSVQVGDSYETPFVIVIDDVDSDTLTDQLGTPIHITHRLDPVTLDNLKEASGAKAVFVSPGPVEVVR